MPCNGSEEDAEDEAAEEDHDDEHAEHGDAVVELQGVVGKEVAEDVAAIERRKRDEVEDEEQQVEQDYVVEKERDGKERGQVLGGDAGMWLASATAVATATSPPAIGVLEDDQQDERNDGGEQVAGRAGERDEDVVAFVVLEVARL